MTQLNRRASDDRSSVDTVWRKSSYSARNGQCVEVAARPSHTAIRDGKLGDRSPLLPFPTRAWTTFLTDLKTGIYDRRTQPGGHPPTE